MPEYTRWLAGEARRQAARPDVLEALLSGRSFAYARHRLELPAVRTLLRTGVTALELQLLAAAFVPWSFIAPLIAYRAACSVVGAAHWGALEVLRERVREAVRQQKVASARIEIERWLGLSLWGGAAAVLATIAFETGAAVLHERIELRDAYALACVVRLGSDSAMRVLHSGVFAVRRVYRPLWSTLAPDLVELGVLVAGFAQLGVWSIPLATVTGGASEAALSYVYVRRSYRQRRFELPRFGRALGAARQFTWPTLRASARSAIAHLSLQLDALILLLLVWAEPAAGGAFAGLYYVLRPLMTAGTHGLRTFYFDLKLVENAGLRALRPRLLRFLERLAVIWAAILAAVGLGAAQLLLDAGATVELLLLIPFFVVRSAFAMLQLVAFGAGELKRLLRLAIVVLSGLAILGSLGLRDLELLFGITLLLAITVAFAARARRASDRATADATGALDLGAWLASTAKQQRVQLAVLLVNSRTGSAGSLVRAVGSTCPAVAIARWGRRYVLVAQPAAGADRLALSERQLIVASGGTLARVWVSPPAVPTAVFESARLAGALPDGWFTTDAGAPGSDAGPELAREFRAQFPEGELLDFDSGLGLLTRRASASQLRALVRCIHAHSCGRRTRLERALPFEIAVFAPAGQARAVFLVDRQTPGFETFRSRAHRASLHSSWPEAFGGARPEAADPGEHPIRREQLST